MKPITHQQIELITKLSFQKRNKIASTSKPKTKKNMKIDNITEQYSDETFLTADGFDKAIIGMDE